MPPRFLNDCAGCTCRCCVQEFERTRSEALAAMEQFATMSPKCHQWLHMGDQLPYGDTGAFAISAPTPQAYLCCSDKLTVLPSCFQTTTQLKDVNSQARMRAPIPMGLRRGRMRLTTGSCVEWQLRHMQLPSANAFSAHGRLWGARLEQPVTFGSATVYRFKKHISQTALFICDMCCSTLSPAGCQKALAQSGCMLSC